MTQINQTKRKAIVLLSLNWYRRKDPRVPLGVAYVYSELVRASFMEGIEVSLVQTDVRENLSNVLHEILKIDPFILGISVYAWNVDQTKQIIDSLIKLGYTGKIVLGGAEITYGGDELNEEFPDVHYFVKGFGEKAFVGIVDALLRNNEPTIQGVYRQGGAICELLAISEPTVDNSPFAQRRVAKLINGNSFVRWQTQRGCVFRCSFYAFKIPNGSISQSEIETVKYELNKMKKNNVSDVAVLDPVFLLEKNRAMAILDLIEQELPNANFSIQTRFEHLDEGIISRISELNIKLECGLQTLDNIVQSRIRRANNRSKLEQVVNQLIQHRVEFETHLIYGHPEQTFSSFFDGVSILFSMGCKKIRVFPLSLLRGTEKEIDSRNSNDLIFSPIFPREILKTKWIKIETMLGIKHFQKRLEGNSSHLSIADLAFLKSLNEGTNC